MQRLAGKGAGLREAVEKLQRDPCDAGGYKLVGPLRDRACGLHMRRDYRLAYTIVPDAVDEEGLGSIAYRAARTVSQRSANATSRTR